MNSQVRRETTQHTHTCTDSQQQMEGYFPWEESLCGVGSCLSCLICSRAFWLFLAQPANTHSHFAHSCIQVASDLVNYCCDYGSFHSLVRVKRVSGATSPTFKVHGGGKAVYEAPATLVVKEQFYSKTDVFRLVTRHLILVLRGAGNPWNCLNFNGYFFEVWKLVGFCRKCLKLPEKAFSLFSKQISMWLSSSPFR